MFSITPTPCHFAQVGKIAMAAGGYVLLASDGLMRLVDVFRVYSAAELFAAARNTGLASLIQRVRTVELDDAYPRAKVHDDASGLLLRWVP